MKRNFYIVTGFIILLSVIIMLLGRQKDIEHTLTCSYYKDGYFYDEIEIYSLDNKIVKIVYSSGGEMKYDSITLEELKTQMTLYGCKEE